MLDTLFCMTKPLCCATLRCHDEAISATLSASCLRSVASQAAAIAITASNTCDHCAATAPKGLPSAIFCICAADCTAVCPAQDSWHEVLQATWREVLLHCVVGELHAVYPQQDKKWCSRSHKGKNSHLGWH